MNCVPGKVNAMNVKKITPESLRHAGESLRGGEIVAFPTETVYGLGANALDGKAVARIFEAKGRPRFNPLIVHIADRDMAEQLAVFDGAARKLADHFWPGPLTLVLPKRDGSGLNELVSAGLPTVALRMPDHDDARALIRASAAPIAAPSANLSGQVSPTTAEHVAADLGDRVDMILDGGPCAAGVESTIVAVDGANAILLRSGAVTRDAIEDVLGEQLAAPQSNENPQAPGMLASHYAPRAELRLDAVVPEAGEAFLAFGPSPSHTGPQLNLSENGDLREAAANLFAYLRLLDAAPTSRIAVAPVPETGLGEAVNDRLRRAAAPR